jgi:diacylglycerol kinase family enzyme
MRRVLALLNARAGTLMDRDGGDVRAEVARALAAPGRQVDVRLTRGRGLARAIDAAGPVDYDTIVIGGGDGSVSYAVRRFAGSDTALGVLPLGTMNLLARDLGMPAQLDAALAALAAAQPRRIDLARLNGRPFHTLSGAGFFSQMARAREETRNLPSRALRVAVAAVRAFGRVGRFSLDLDIDGMPQTIDAFAVLVTNNRFGPDWRRTTLDGGELEIHVAEDRGALGKLRTGADLLTGTWRDNPGVHSFPARTITIATSRPRVWVSTDGELARVGAPLHYELMPRALSVLAPPAGAQEPS